MKCQEQSQDSEVCGYVPKEGELAEPEFTQSRGNAEAQERLQGEPIDIDAVDRDGSFAMWAAAMAAQGEVVESGSGVRSMVDGVKQKAGGRPIRRLSIHGHGTPGTVRVGRQAIANYSIPANLAPLAELAPRIRPLLLHDALQQVRANLAQRKQAAAEGHQGIRARVKTFCD